MKPSTLPLWHVIVSIPGLNIDKYILSETEPTLEQIQEVWDADGGTGDKIKPRGWSGPLRDAYPGVGRIERIAVSDFLPAPAATLSGDAGSRCDKADLLESILADALLRSEGWTHDAIQQSRVSNDEDWKSAVRRAFAVASMAVLAPQPPRAETPVAAGEERQSRKKLCFTYCGDGVCTCQNRELTQDESRLVMSALFSSTVPASTTPPAEAKTPDAGVGGFRRGMEAAAIIADDLAESLSVHGHPSAPRESTARLVAANIREALTPTGSAGEDDTGVRQALEFYADPASYRLALKSGERIPVLDDNGDTARVALASQPPRAETPTRVLLDGLTLEQLIHNYGAAEYNAAVDANEGADPEHYEPKIAEARAKLMQGIAALLADPAARPGADVERDAARWRFTQRPGYFYLGPTDNYGTYTGYSVGIQAKGESVGRSVLVRSCDSLVEALDKAVGLIPAPQSSRVEMSAGPTDDVGAVEYRVNPENPLFIESNGVGVLMAASDTEAAWLVRVLNAGQNVLRAWDPDGAVRPPRSESAPTLAAPAPALRFTPEVGDAADAYLRSVALYGRYDLPARCRFHELFDVMVRAAQRSGDQETRA